MDEKNEKAAKKRFSQSRRSYRHGEGCGLLTPSASIVSSSFGLEARSSLNALPQDASFPKGSKVNRAGALSDFDSLS